MYVCLLVLKPVASEQDNNMEINATNGLLADIFDLNKELKNETDEVSIPEEEVSILQEEFSTSEDDVSSHEEDTDMEGIVPLDGSDTQPQDDHTARGGADWLIPLADPVQRQTDIRQFLMDGNG